MVTTLLTALPTDIVYSAAQSVSTHLPLCRRRLQESDRNVHRSFPPILMIFRKSIWPMPEYRRPESCALQLNKYISNPIYKTSFAVVNSFSSINSFTSAYSNLNLQFIKKLMQLDSNNWVIYKEWCLLTSVLGVFSLYNTLTLTAWPPDDSNFYSYA